MKYAFFSALAWLAVTFLSVAPANASEDIVVYTVEAPFADVASDVNDAIVNRGYLVDYHGLIGEMLKRTAADVGATETLYRNAEFFQFCSAVVSRRVMEQDAANIAYCPYILFVYETEDAPGKVNVGFRRLPDGGGRDEVNTLLDEMAREVSGN